MLEEIEVPPRGPSPGMPRNVVPATSCRSLRGGVRLVRSPVEGVAEGRPDRRGCAAERRGGSLVVLPKECRLLVDVPDCPGSDGAEVRLFFAISTGCKFLRIGALGGAAFGGREERSEEAIDAVGRC